jgi:flagellar biosynthesis protein FlhG
MAKKNTIKIPQILPVGGGKGGIGKSLIVANLGVLIAKQGIKVALVDLDLGASNLHTFIGEARCHSGLNHFLSKREASLEKVAIQSDIQNLHLISSIGCTEEVANLFAAQKNKIIKAIKKMPYECVLLDLGAGTNFNTLDFFLTSNSGIFICTPEPTSIENAFKFIKAVYLRKAKRILKTKAFKPIYEEILRKAGNTSKQSSKFIEAVIQFDPEKGAMFQKQLSEFKFKFIINQFKKSADSMIGQKIEKVCNRHFYSEFEFLGNISFDERVYESILSKKIFVSNYSYTISAIELNHIAKKIVGNHIDKIPQPLIQNEKF